MEPIAIFVAAGCMILIARLIAGGLDGVRIEAYAAEQGWKLLESQWAPFGPGWYGSKGPRIYQIRYIDVQGDERVAHLKTSMYSGVYMTKGRVITPAPRRTPGDVPGPAEPPSAADLERENEELKQRIKELTAPTDGAP